MHEATLGERFADNVARNVGSWRFVIAQSVTLACWIMINALGWVTWDGYPFILLNLLLSFQAAYTAPFIMMSQNRQSAIDRDTFINDFMREFEELKELHAESQIPLSHLDTLSHATQLQLEHLDVLRQESALQLNHLTRLSSNTSKVILKKRKTPKPSPKDSK